MQSVNLISGVGDNNPGYRQQKIVTICLVLILIILLSIYSYLGKAITNLNLQISKIESHIKTGQSINIINNSWHHFKQQNLEFLKFLALLEKLGSNKIWLDKIHYQKIKWHLLVNSYCLKNILMFVNKLKKLTLVHDINIDKMQVKQEKCGAIYQLKILIVLSKLKYNKHD